jgi:hypothetical protein
MMVLIDYSRKLWKGSETSLAYLPQVVETIDDLEQLDPLLANLQFECTEFDTNPRRRKIMIFIDNYDAFTDESSRKKSAFFEGLAGLVRKYQTAGVYMVVGGSVSITGSSDDLRKVFAAPNFGIALKSADAVNRLYGKFPRSLADSELPMGRAFTVQSGITKMLQLATPYASDEDIDGSVDEWVQKIQKRHPGKKVLWMRPADTASNESNSAADGQAPDNDLPTEGVSLSQRDLSKYDMEEVKKLLKESGFPEEMMSILSDGDIVETAIGMGLIPDDAKSA